MRTRGLAVDAILVGDAVVHALRDQLLQVRMVRDFVLGESLHVHDPFGVLEEFKFTPAVQQVEQLVALDFLETDFQLVVGLFEVGEDLHPGQVIQPVVLWIAGVSLLDLLAHHGERLAGPGLTVREKGNFVPVKEFVDQGTADGLEDVQVVFLVAEDVVKQEFRLFDILTKV